MRFPNLLFWSFGILCVSEGTDDSLYGTTRVGSDLNISKWKTRFVNVGLHSDDAGDTGGIGTSGSGIDTSGSGIGTSGSGIGTSGSGIGTSGSGIGTSGMAKQSESDKPNKTFASFDLNNLENSEIISGHESEVISRKGYWAYLVSSGFLVLVSGFASGTTIGLLSLDPIQLKVLATNGCDSERSRARDVSSVISKHHLLLVTLLITNTIATETLPIFLDKIVPAWLAILLSVTFILFFGEVLPQAFCTGPKQLTIASAMLPIVKILIVCFFVIAYPLSKLLDWLLGENEKSLYTRHHLKALIRMHQKGERQMSQTMRTASRDDSALGADEVVVIEGALDLASKTLEQIMIPIEKVFMLEWHTELTEDIMAQISKAGYSRVPVYRSTRHNIRGLILVKSLILVDPKKGIKAHEALQSKFCLFERGNRTAYDMLNEFQNGSSHMAFVSNECDEYKQCLCTGEDVSEEAKVLGVATLEDVIEELIQEEIYDEFDTQPETPCIPLLSARIRKSINSAKLSIGKLKSEKESLLHPNKYQTNDNKLLSLPKLP